ncbi:MAG: NUDIX hydrolase [Solirubrobacteraceae bacterium]
MPLTLTLRRWGYRSAYRLLQVFWFVRRPTKHGVKCLLTDHDRVLLVRHTYGLRAWDLPGGAIKRGEAPLSAAQREMDEELGVRDADWTDLGPVRGRVDRRHDTIHCFSAELAGPDLTIDRGEIAAAQWFTRTALPTELGPYVRPVIVRADARIS